MCDYMRLKDPDSRHEFTYSARMVELLGLQDWVIDAPPLAADGSPARPRYVQRPPKIETAGAEGSGDPTTEVGDIDNQGPYGHPEGETNG